MDPEAIRELIAAFRELGGDAKEAFIWYVVMSYVPNFLLGAAWTGGGLVAIHKIIDIAKSFVPSERLILAYGSRGPWMESELNEACEILRKAKQAKGRAS